MNKKSRDFSYSGEVNHSVRDRDINGWAASRLSLAEQGSKLTRTPSMFTAIERLAEVCHALVQPSRLLNLPDELLHRVLRELD